MKIFFSEADYDYNQYLFPYQVLLLKEKQDSLGDIYNLGFLPFRNKKDLFYLSRSCRSNLKQIEQNNLFSSENRRIIKKTKNFSFNFIEQKSFKYNLEVQKQCRFWAKARNWQISVSSIKKLFSGDFFNWILEVKKQEKTIAYSIILKEGSLAHWAYVFYDPEFSNRDLVIRMGLEVINWAKQAGLDLVYLGTCYGESGYYKRNFPGFEFFNGFSWSNDLKELDYLNRREKRKHLLADKEYLEKFQAKPVKGV